MTTGRGLHPGTPSPSTRSSSGRGRPRPIKSTMVGPRARHINLFILKGAARAPDDRVQQDPGQDFAIRLQRGLSNVQKEQSHPEPTEGT